jgi:ubiquinone/menaquinone biosynthesis C-methylase UbiE
MPSRTDPPTARFDAGAWSQLYDGPPSGESLIFRRSSAQARAVCAALMRPGAAWLDVGCGTGHLLQSCGATGARLIGADHDAAMLDFAAQRWGSGHVPYVCAAAAALPFAEMVFAGIVATSLVGCLPQPGPLFAEAHRVLESGGHLVFTLTNRASRLLMLQAVLQRAGRATDRARIRLHDEPDIVAALTAAGFEIVQIRRYSFFLSVGRRVFPPETWIDRLDQLGRYRVSRRWARNVLVVARKADGARCAVRPSLIRPR